MNVDNTKIILDYYLDDEITNFNNKFLLQEEVNFLDSDNDTDENIEIIEKINQTDHIVYNLLKLKLEMEKEIIYRKKNQDALDLIGKVTRGINDSHL